MQRAQRMQPFSRSWLLTTASAIAGLAVIGIYVAIIVSQAGGSPAEVAQVAPWILVMATAALMPVVALFSRKRAIVAGCLLGSAAIWTVIGAISSLFIVAFPTVFLIAFAYASYRESTKEDRRKSHTTPMVSS